MEEIKPFTIVRPWGNFRQFNQNSPVTVKILTIKKKEELSLQSHAKRVEFWHVLGGGGTMEAGDNRHDVSPGDEQNIPIGVSHKLIAGPSGMQVLEIATGDFLEEQDEIRYEDKYGRA